MTRRDEDTPTKPLTPVDEECHSFLASLPPPAPSEAAVRFAMRPRTSSDLFEIEEIQREHREFVARQAAEKVMREKDRADRAEEALAQRDAFWRDIAKSVVSGVITWAVIGLVALLAALAVAWKH